MKDDTVAIILDPNIAPPGSSGGYTGTVNGSTWTMSFSNFTMHGISACLSTNYGLQRYDIYTANNGVLIDNGKVVVGGERNGGLNACFCKMTYPVVSGWWYFRAGWDCPDWCNVDWCSHHTFRRSDVTNMTVVEIRQRIFNSIQN